MTTTRFRVPPDVVLATQRHLRANGSDGNEGVVLWVGTFDPPAILDALIPDQRVGPGRFEVSLHERQRIARELAGTGKIVVAQVHSHPGEAFHSWIDDRDAIPRRIGSYSLVVPRFGALPNLLNDAALFQLNERGGWIATSLEAFDLEEDCTPSHHTDNRFSPGRVFRWLTGKLKS